MTSTAPVVVLGARNWIAPPAEMEWEFFVTPEDILDAIHTRVLPLPGHQIQEGPGAEGTLEESRSGYLIRLGWCFPVNCWVIPLRRGC